MMGFRSACDAMALLVFIYTLFYFIFNGRSEIFESDTSKDESQEAATQHEADEDVFFKSQLLLAQKQSKSQPQGLQINEVLLDEVSHEQPLMTPPSATFRGLTLLQESYL